MIRIEIGRRFYLPYLLLAHGTKMSLLSAADRERLRRINDAGNEAHFSGQAAVAYDRIHRYGETEQHEFPAAALVGETWAPEGYGRALELGAGSGYFTRLLARRAASVVAIEPVADLRRVIEAHCAEAGIGNVRVVGAAATELDAHVPRGSIDSALIVQSLHHFDQRERIFEALGRAVRPGGRLYLVEPHHNVRRVARLLRGWLRTYRAPAFWRDERNWATHDFLTLGEIRRLCRRGGFGAPRVTGYWFPFSRRVVPDARRRVAVERRMGRVPGLRHLAGVIAVEARRSEGPTG